MVHIGDGVSGIENGVKPLSIRKDTNGAPMISLYQVDNGDGAFMEFDGAASNEHWQIGSGVLGFYFYNMDDAAYRMVMTNAGNVAIGSTSASEKLSVTGNIFATGNISGSSTSTGSFGVVRGGNFRFIGDTNTGISKGSSDQLRITLGDTTRFTFAATEAHNSSNVRILNETPSSTNPVFTFNGYDDGLGGDANTAALITNVLPRVIAYDGGVEFPTVNGQISGSATSTGSFGRINATRVSASKYVGQIGSRFVHSQTSDSATWVINHNIGHKYPVVTVYDDSDQMILPQNGVANDSDTFTLTFNEAIQGKAVVSVGGIGENAGANFIHYQSDSSTNWRVTHSLSQQYPNVTVYDDLNQVIIPETITAASSNEMDITFSSGKSGYANFSIGSGIPNISAANAGKVLKVRPGGQGVEWSPTSNDVSGSMLVSGSILPDADNHHDLGSASKRWANLHTGDIQLSNEGTEGNEVDGTTGSWTIQEGEDDLYLLNRKNGKKYKFKLEEIT